MTTLPSTRRAFIQSLALTAAGAVLSRTPARAAETESHPSVRSAMDRAAKCCLAWLNPEQQFLPTGGYEVAHDTGRWWDAMLRYEAATGVPIPTQAEDAMLQNLRALTDNPAGLLTASLCNPHNLRESLIAYAALARYRKSDWARQQGHRLVETIHRLLEADGQLNYARLAEITGKPLTKDPLMVQRSPTGEWFNATATTGRAIEATIWFHEATADPLAMELAGRLAEIHLRQSIDPTGRVRPELLDPSHVGHTHSYCGTLRGLLLYGLARGDRKFVDAIAATYRHGLWGTTISHSGWTPHDQGKIRFTGKEGDPVGEHASCGDIAQIALWLALRDGQFDLLDDVERLVRARLLPSQLTDEKNPRRDGSWGVYAHPFGTGAILDVFAAVLHSLADFHEHIVTATRDGTVSVNLHFDTDTALASVRTKREQNASLLITLKAPGSGLRIRVPGWASRESVRLAVDGQSRPLRWDGSYVLLAQEELLPRSSIALSHDLPAHQSIEEMPTSHRQFRLNWRGDTVIACDPRVPIYPAG